jgi:CMP-N-acetylneuraminic acid synthetase
MFNGMIRAYVVPNERALDIDTEYDLMIGEMLLTKGAHDGSAAV